MIYRYRKSQIIQRNMFQQCENMRLCRKILEKMAISLFPVVTSPPVSAGLSDCTFHSGEYWTIMGVAAWWHHRQQEQQALKLIRMKIYHNPSPHCPTGTPVEGLDTLTVCIYNYLSINRFYIKIKWLNRNNFHWFYLLIIILRGLKPEEFWFTLKTFCRLLIVQYWSHWMLHV